MAIKRNISERNFKKPVMVFTAIICLVVIAWLSGIATSVEIKTGSYIAWFKGNIAYDNGDYGSAEILYSKALKADTTVGKLNYNLGNTLYNQGRYSEAIQAYKQAFHTPDIQHKAATWNNLGNAYFLTDSLEQSAYAYRKAILLRENDNVVRQNLVYVSGKLQKINQHLIARLNKNTAANNKDKPGAKNRNKNQDEKADPNDQHHQNELSNKTVEALFSQVEQNEHNLRGRISRSKLNNDASNAGADY